MPEVWIWTFYGSQVRLIYGFLFYSNKKLLVTKSTGFWNDTDQYIGYSRSSGWGLRTVTFFDFIILP
jgi:hypothetical protein